jgi:TatD DNase family protein
MCERTLAGQQGTPQWIDNHCHLGHGSAYDELLIRARDRGVVGFIDVAVDLDSARGCLGSAAREPDVWATAGVHPHSASAGTDGLAELVEANLGHRKLVAVGECGLDFHYDNSPRAAQRDVFRRQVSLANRVGLPLVVHTRDAWEDTFSILDAEGVPLRTVFHCFTGGPDEATEALERGALLSISGIITFNSARDLAEAVRRTPLERLMVETDSPYLAPVPHRGRPNQPAWVSHVGSRIAEVKALQVEEVSAVTLGTTREFYALGQAGQSAEASGVGTL